MSDAAGNVRAGRRNPTVGDSHRPACGGFASAALCHNGDNPDTVISRSGEAGRGGGAGQKKSTKNRRNAIKTHNQILAMCVMEHALMEQLCLKFAASRQ